MVRKKKRSTRNTSGASISARRLRNDSTDAVNLTECDLSYDPDLRPYLHLFEFFIPVKLKKNIDNYKLAYLRFEPKWKVTTYCQADTVYLYCGVETSECLFYWEEESPEEGKRARGFLAYCGVPIEVFQALENRRHFELVFSFPTPEQETFFIDIYINPGIVLNLNHPSDAIHGGIKVGVQTVVHFFYGIGYGEYPDKTISDKRLVQSIYKSVRNCYDTDGPIFTTGHRNLIPELRPYQSQAVQWMLRKEFKTEDDVDLISSIHPLYHKLYLPDMKSVLYNVYGGFFVEISYKRVPLYRGGVLSDEMGLGKTVEVLACILLNPMDKEHEADLPELIDISGDTEDEDEEYTDESDGTDSEDGRGTKRQLDEDESMNPNEKVEIVPTPEVEAQRYYLGCVCGSYGLDENENTTVTCSSCKLVQHADCVLNDPDNVDDDYICPYCWVSGIPYVSRATLIVAPAAIIYQWLEEIRKHVRRGALRVFLYRGIQYHRFIQPPDLADYDIVLTTYETLRKELNYVKGDTGRFNRNLRHPKKFAALPSPLTSIYWWRICLDEAQMVESVTTKTSTMTMQLLSVNRWCVSGTPIPKSVEDLYGLLLFLGYDPFCYKFWWKELVLKPAASNYNRLLFEIVNKIMWRTPKHKVLDQIGVPPQTQITHKLDFAAVEKAFYDQHHKQCSNDFKSKIVQYGCADSKLNELSQKVVRNLMLPLRKLRQACCHPQIVRGEFSVKKSTMTMPELLEVMIRRAQNVCEEKHRQLVASMNGLAGIHLIKNNYPKAVEIYEKVLESVEERAQFFKTDKLQLFHTLHNLSEILNYLFCQPTGAIRIELDQFLSERVTEGYITSLKTKADDLHTSYLSKHLASVISAKETLISASRQTEEIQSQAICHKNAPWWLHTISFYENRDENFSQRVKAELFQSQVGQLNLAQKITDCAGLKYIVTRHLDFLQSENERIKHVVHGLSIRPSSCDLQDAAYCHLRPGRQSRIKCVFCRVDSDLNRYESILFRFNDYAAEANRLADNEPAEEREEGGGGGDDDVDIIEEHVGDQSRVYNPLRRGTWADSELEVILKCLLSAAKCAPELKILMDDGLNHLKWFEALKKEFKCLRHFWMQITNYVSAIDETEMGKIRMRLNGPNEPTDGPYSAHLVSPLQVESTQLRFEDDVSRFDSELKKKLGHMFYLQNLNKTNEDSNSITSQLCPVCRAKFGHIWSVLSCGHSVCELCIQILLMHHTVGNNRPGINCPICRQLCYHGDISHVHSSNEELLVKGSWSSKVTGIINCLNKIANDNNTAKSLVFCNWAKFLGLLGQSLEENEIPYLSLANKKDSKENLQKFKTDPYINVLLLPYSAGANGLNIIEATHVLLVEPSLDHSVVQQAIGRIHRIGQTKETFVHQFVVKDTIEEKIFEIQRQYSTDDVDLDSSSLSVNDIEDLFKGH